MAKERKAMAKGKGARKSDADGEPRRRMIETSPGRVLFNLTLPEEARYVNELLDKGGMLITEFDAGRVFEVNARGGRVWEYVNHFDDQFVGEITNAARYDADYFTVDWNSCN